MLQLSELTWGQNQDSVVPSNIIDTSIIHKLSPVTLHTNTYKADSINNRAENEFIFDYRKKKINMGDNKWNRTIVVMGSSFFVFDLVIIFFQGQVELRFP